MKAFANRSLPFVVQRKKTAPGPTSAHAWVMRSPVADGSLDQRMRTSLTEQARGSAQAMPALDTGYGDLVAAARATGVPGMPGDPLEREADRMAEAIGSTTALPVAAAVTSTALVQRSCETCTDKQSSQGEDAARDTATTLGVDTMPVSAIPKDTGAPLATPIRGFMESRFGHDFSPVRVHADASAHSSARALQARAYTIGNDVFFANGQYAPQTAAGQKLLAHELTHVVQQGRDGQRLQRQADAGRAPEVGPAREGESDTPGKADGSKRPTTGLCLCAFKGKIGKLRIDPSCRGKLALWVIPEQASEPAFTEPQSDIAYRADGFVLNGVIYKIDGSTCVDIYYTEQGLVIETCVNLVAGVIGKKGPYRVPPGTFANEPAAGTPARPVR